MLRWILLIAFAFQTPEKSIVTGRLFSADGAPAVGVRVAALDATSKTVVTSALTDTTGRYRLEDVPMGRYYLAAGPVERPTYYPGTRNAAEATEVSVSIIETIGIANFALARDTSGPRRAQLELKVTGPLSIDMNQDARRSYETLGRMAGLNIVFASRFSPGPADTFRAENVDIFRAFDLLSAMTSNFWEPLDKKTIFVGPADLGRQNVDAFLELKEALAGAAVKTQLQPANPEPLSFSLDLESREAFKAIAEMSGINVVFEPAFQSHPVQLKLENTDIQAALDILCLQDNKFWIPYNSKTVLLGEDNPVSRSDYGLHVVKTIQVGGPMSRQQINEVLNILRSGYGFTYVFPFRNAFVVRDIPSRVALAEKVIADRDKASQRIVRENPEGLLISESGFVRNPKPKASELQLKSAGAVSVKMTEDARKSYEVLARTAGIQIAFDSRFIPGIPTEFHVENVDIFDALNLLSLQTGNFWQISDDKTIVVAPDVPAIRRELEPQIRKTFNVARGTSSADIAAIANALRSVLGIRDVSTEPGSAISLRDTPARLILAETLIQELDKTR
jgi:hypothetical protein